MKNRSTVLNWIILASCIMNMIYCITSTNITNLRIMAIIGIVGYIIIDVMMIILSRSKDV